MDSFTTNCKPPVVVRRRMQCVKSFSWEGLAVSASENLLKRISSVHTLGSDGVVEVPFVHSHTYCLLGQPYPVPSGCGKMKITVSAQR